MSVDHATNGFYFDQVAPLANFVHFACDDVATCVLSDSSSPVILGSCLIGSTWGVKNLTPAAVVSATNNWWGDRSGPSGAGTGTGATVSSGVLYSPWRTTPCNVGSDLEIFPSQGGNQGSITAEIYGNDLDPQAAVRLTAHETTRCRLNLDEPQTRPEARGQSAM